jgi:hypothetical protein
MRSRAIRLDGFEGQTFCRREPSVPSPRPFTAASWVVLPGSIRRRCFRRWETFKIAPEISRIFLNFHQMYTKFESCGLHRRSTDA